MSFKAQTSIALIAGAALITLSGCGTMQHKGAKSMESAADLEKREKMLLQNEARVAKREQAIEARENRNGNIDLGADQKQHTPAMASGGNEVFPPNPQAGQCYARIHVPAKYETVAERVVEREASTRIETVPAKLEWMEEKVEVRPASTRLEIVPAQYEKIAERIMVTPETKKLVEVPAQYATVSEKVLDKPAHTVWKRNNKPAAGVKTRIDANTGDIMCLVEVPATYKTITRSVLKSPASVKEMIVPAQYKTVTRTVLKSPPTTKEVEVPAEYKMVKVQKVVQPASTREVDIPAEFATITKQRKVQDEKLSWQTVLCDINMNPKMVRTMQEKLKTMGYYHAAIDGIYGPETASAVNRFASEKGYAMGENFVSVDAAEALDIDF